MEQNQHPRPAEQKIDWSHRFGYQEASEVILQDASCRFCHSMFDIPVYSRLLYV